MKMQKEKEVYNMWGHFFFPSTAMCIHHEWLERGLSL